MPSSPWRAACSASRGSPMWAHLQATWSLCARPPCPSTSLRSSATSCSTRWPVPSACLRLWTLSPRWTRAAWSWCRRATPRGRGRFPRARAWARTGTCMTWQPLMSRAARWPPTAPSSRAAWSRLPATCASMPWTFPTCRAPACSRTSTCLPSRGKRLRLWAPRAPARRPLPTSSTASTRSMTARSRTTASTSSTLPRPACAGRSASCYRIRTCLAAPLRRTSALASSTRPTRRYAPLPRPPAPTRLSAVCRGATTHRSRPTAPTCRRVSVSCSPSRAWPSPIRRCSSWMRPRAPLTRVPKSSSSAVWTASCAVAPRL